MERVDVESVDATGVGGVTRRRLGDAIGTSDVAVNHYSVDPDERIAGLHAHYDQEEVFVVLGGEVVFETLDGGVTVSAGEAVRFPPGEYQSCTNPGDGDAGAGVAVVLALGAPADSQDVRVPVRCSACGNGEHRLTFPDGEERLRCRECGAETVPQCPECDGDRLRVVLDDDARPVDRCRDCGATTPAR